MANWWDNLYSDKPAKDPFANISFYNPTTPDLPSRQIAPSYGTLPGGGTSGSPLAAGRTVDWSKLALMGGTLASSLFAGGTDTVSGPIKEVQQNARNQMAQGQTLATEGQANIADVTKYFRALASGDPGQMLAATQPERSRVIDQYDAARKSAAQFTPRGGGQASTQQELRGREASDLANLTAGARRDAISGLATLGMGQQQTGLSMEQQAQQHLATVLAPLLQEEQHDTAKTIQTYAGIAAMIASFL